MRKHDERLNEQELLNVVTDSYRFILHEVVNPRGRFYHPEHSLAHKDKYVGVRVWENLEYHLE